MSALRRSYYLMKTYNLYKEDCVVIAVVITCVILVYFLCKYEFECIYLLQECCLTIIKILVKNCLTDLSLCKLFVLKYLHVEYL